MECSINVFVCDSTYHQVQKCYILQAERICVISSLHGENHDFSNTTSIFRNTIAVYSIPRMVLFSALKMMRSVEHW
jgi:hypothetical protein